MQKDISTGLEGVLAKRKDFAQLVFIAAVLAFGVNLVAGAVMDPQIVSRNFYVAMGAALVFLALAWLLMVSFSNRRFGTHIEACFLFDPRTKQILGIRHYKFSEELARTMHAVLMENKAFERDWREDPLSKVRQPAATLPQIKKTAPAPDTSRNQPEFVAITKIEMEENDQEPKSALLLRETVEYFLLEELSLHLSEYFDDFPDATSYTRAYERKDIPSLLLENRVLSMLTRPLEERETFIKAFKGDSRPEGELHTMWSSDGAIYSRFELILPRGTVITRPESGKIVIENSRIRLSLSVEYSGTDTVVPFEFLEFYTRVDPLEIMEKAVNVSLEYQAKPLGLLHRSGWEYYRWVDSFAAELEEGLSFPSFLRRINWDSLSVLTTMLEPQLSHENRPRGSG